MLDGRWRSATSHGIAVAGNDLERLIGGLVPEAILPRVFAWPTARQKSHTEADHDGRVEGGATMHVEVTGWE